MFNCQFCGFDYSEQGLRDGRCPSCGVLLAWQEESAENSATRISDSELPTPLSLPSDAVEPSPQSPPQPPSPASPAETPVGIPAEDQSAADSPATESPSTSPSTGAPPSPPSPPHTSTVRTDVEPLEPSPQKPAGLDTDQSRQLKQIWSKSITTRPETTIQTPSNYGTVSNLVIRQRALAKPETPTHSPADYELLGVIGEGGVGVVYSARQASINRTVALKMLHGHIDQENEKGKFLAEAVVTGELDHPNIVPIYDLGTNQEGALFYSMKQVHGTPWSEVIKSKSLIENLDILMKVGDAIAFAHARRVVHRDLKPENVMLGEFGEVLVMDWGLALSISSLEASEDEPHAGMGGTPAYMSPEMAAGPINRIGKYSDVYLMGAILYECITGRPPHHGATVLDCISSAWLNEILPTEISGELIDIAYRAMATEPTERYESIQAFQDAIREYQSHTESIALVNRGQVALEQAKRSGDYKEFSRSIVAYEEASSLWAENDEATAGLKAAVMAYAEAALEKGDFELGLSLLDEERTDHQPLIERLRHAARERDARQQRIASLRRTAVALVTLMLLGATGATIFCYGQWQLAEEAKEAADIAKGDADRQREAAVASKVDAETARQSAEAALTQAEVASANEAESMYRFEIQLANERINDNAFQNAEKLLDDQANSFQRKYRHWEWGRLRYLCELAEATLTRGESTRTAPVMAVAATPAGDRLAALFADGEVLIWDRDERPFDQLPAMPPRRLRVEGAATSLELSDDGQLLAVAVDGGRSRIELFRLETEEPQKIRELLGHGGAIHSLRFSQDQKRLLSASEDQTARLWTLFSDEAPVAFYGHFEAVHSAAFSNDESLIVTASADGSARIWDPRTGAEAGRFQAHSGTIYDAIFLPGDTHVASGGADGQILIWPVVIDRQVLDSESAVKAKRRFADQQVNLVKQLLQEETVPSAQQFITLAAHDGAVRSLTLAASGQLLVSGGDDATIRVWDPRRAEPKLAAAANDAATPRWLETLRRRAEPSQSHPGLLATLRGHGSWISAATAIDQTADEQPRVLTGSYDRTMKVWDLASYQEVETYQFNGRAIVSATQSQDGQWLAAALDDGTARIWQGSQGVVTLPPLTEGHSFLTTQAVLHAASNRLYTVAGDNTVSVWNWSSGGQVEQFEGAGREGVLAVSPNGQWLVTGSDTPAGQVWDHDGPIAQLDHVRIVQTQLAPAFPKATPEQLAARAERVTAACVAADNDTVFLGDNGGGGWLWSIEQARSESPAAPRSRQLHQGRVTAAAFANRGRRLITASSDSTIAIWDLDQPADEAVRRIRHNGPVTRLVLADDERHLATATVQRRQLSRDRWETRTELHYTSIDAEAAENSLRLRLPDGRDVERVNSISLSGDGESALVACSVGAEDHLLKWNLAGGEAGSAKPIWKNDTFRGAISTALLTDGGDVLTVGGRGAVLWTDKGEKKRSFQPHSNVTSIRFSPNARFVVTTGTDGIAKVWTTDREVPRVAAKLELPPTPEATADDGDSAEATNGGHSRAVTSAVFHPLYNDQVVTVSADRSARRWRFDEDGNVQVLAVYGGPQGHTDTINAVAFSPSGEALATASTDGTTRIWLVEQPAAPVAVLQHPAAVQCVAFSPAGHWLATGGGDNVVRVWDARTHEMLTELAGHSSVVSAVDFSLDAQRLLSASRDATALLWDLKPLYDSRSSDEASSASEQDTANEATNREILILEHHHAEITDASFSSDGRTIITASRDGRVTLSHSRQVEPSLLLTVGDPIECHGEWVKVDPRAMLRQPNRVPFAGYTIVADILDDPLGGEELMLRPNSTNGLRIDDSFVVIGDEESAAIGRVSIEPTPQLRVELTESATAESIQAILHSLAYRNTEMKEVKSDTTRSVRIRLLDPNGVSGNFENAIRRDVRKVRLIAPELEEPTDDSEE